MVRRLLINRLPLGALVWGGLAGCSPELVVADNLLIQCSTAADCPADLMCSTTVGRCVDPEAVGTVRMATGALTLSQGTVKAGDTIFIRTRFTGPLAHWPRCELIQGAKDFQCATGDYEDGVFSSSYTVQGDEEEGAAVLRFHAATYVDEAVFDTSGKVVFDFTPPGRPLDHSLSPQLGFTGGEVTLRFVATEALVGSPQVRAVGGFNDVTHRMAGGLNGDTSEYVFKLPLSTDVTSGMYTVSISRQVDEAGNQSEPIELGEFQVLEVRL